MPQLLTAGVEWLPEMQTLFGPLIGWLKEWQFLAASLIVVFAGAITVNAINRQNRRQRFKAKEEERRSRVRAFRATMPEDLRAICSYACRSAQAGREALLIINAQEEEELLHSSKGRHNRPRFPALPTSVPLNLKVLIENLDESTSEQVVDLLRCYYSQRARLADALENLNNQSNPSTITVSKSTNLNPFFKDTLELYLRAKGMLQFASGESENIAGVFDPSEVINALKELNIDHVISPEGKEHCLRVLSKAPTGEGLGRILSRR